jgi:hypothetical protein
LTSFSIGVVLLRSSFDFCLASPAGRPGLLRVSCSLGVPSFIFRVLGFACKAAHSGE